ncbi:MAG: hypothetical protein V3T31_03120 [candidate division Zixibacteria bacterium]
MSYTTTEQVTNHLISAAATTKAIFDQAVVMNGSDNHQFFGGSVLANSVLIKSVRSDRRYRKTLTLVSGTVNLGAENICRDSVLVASDSSAGTLYVENKDYYLNFKTGQLTTKASGALGDSQEIAVWYSAYKLYQISSDYQIDADRGYIRRLVSGEIADGEMVLLDYEPLFQSFNDAVIAAAVSEANGLVEAIVDPDQSFGADPTLTLAATYRALAIVCRAAATRELSGRKGGEKTAMAWLHLAGQYGERSSELIADFRPAVGSPSAPTHS